MPAGDRDRGSTRPAPSSPHRSTVAAPTQTPRTVARLTTATAELATSLPERFRPKRTLGKGGMGIVLLARDTVLRRDVAIKLLRHADGDARLLEEARAAAELRHESIVTIYDVDPEGRFIVMELIEGETLEDRLAKHGRLSASAVYRLGRALLGALKVAHAAGIIHRDIKPANVLYGKSGAIKLNDFGVARRAHDESVPAGAGTPAYIAPEVWEGTTENEQTDLFSVGVVLWEAAVGRGFRSGPPPEDFEAKEVLRKTQDPKLAAAISKALSEDPTKRWQTAAEFAEALRRTEPKPKRARWFAPVMVALVFAVSAGAAYLLSPKGGAAATAPTTNAVIATLPFIDHTGSSQLDFARVGLPHILATELRRDSALQVISYYQLLERTPKAPAAEDVDAWRARAAELGATLVVAGTLEKAGDDVTITLSLLRANGTTVANISARTAATSIPAMVRAKAAEIGALATGRKTPAKAGPPRDFAIERDVALGVDALQQLHLAEAKQLLGGVLERDPKLADAAYYYALTVYWESNNDHDVDAAFERALATDLLPEQRGVIVGFQSMHRREREKSIEYFRGLAEKYPNTTEVAYGLSEALFHGGYPAEGMAVYRQLADAAPSFRLGLIHPLIYYMLHGLDEGARWAVARVHTFEDSTSTAWSIRLRLSRGDVEGAHTALLAEETGKDASWVGPDLLIVAMLAGDRDTVLRLVRTPGGATPHAIAAAMWLGDMTEAKAAYDRLHTRSAAEGRGGAYGLAVCAPLTILADDASFAERNLATLDALIGGDRQGVNEMLAHAFLYARLGKRAELDALAKSTVPEVAAVATALAMNADGKPAAKEWAHAAQLSGDGNFVVAGKVMLAQAQRAASDHQGVLDACRDAMRPRTLDPAAGPAALPCLPWSAEAALALGKRDEAIAFYKRAIALRPKDRALAAALKQVEAK